MLEFVIYLINDADNLTCMIVAVDFYVKLQQFVIFVLVLLV